MLPKSVDYSEPLSTLPPDTQSFQVVCTPISSSSFSTGSQIDVDLGSRGHLVPGSLMIRYKGTAVGLAAQDAFICGTPVYTPFLRLNTMINSQTTETINNYNVISNLVTNLTKDVAQKYGEQYSLGYAYPDAALAMENLDGGQLLNATPSRMYSAPLPCALAYSEKLIPLYALNGIRLTFTLDTLANICSAITSAGSAAVALPTEFTITNFEVIYQCVDFGKDVEAQVLSIPRLRIKSTTWASSVQNVAAGTTGQVNLNYNLKYSSIKALIANFGGTSRVYSATAGQYGSGNGNMDSFDLSRGGDYQFQIGGINYPQRALSSGYNKGGILQSLRYAVGSLFDRSNALSINSVEFDTSSLMGATNTSVTRPAKFWVGVCTEKLRVPVGGFFSGISTENGAITLTSNIVSANPFACNAMLILAADYILEIDPQTRQVVVIQ